MRLKKKKASDQLKLFLLIQNLHVPMTKAPCNNSEHALCFMKWDCKNPLKNDIRNSIKTQFPLIRL